MNNDVWPKRLFALDVSRGFAALAVVLWHWKHFAYKGNILSPDFIQVSQPLYGLLRLFYENGAAGVEYFFLLSGFIFFWLYREPIQNRAVSPGTFIVQRFSRLYPLHFVTLLTVALLQLLYVSRENVSFVYPFNDAYHFLLNLGLASKWGIERGWSFNAPVWAVSIEVLLYLIFFLAAFFRQGGWLFSLSVAIASFVLFHLVHHAVFQGLSLFFIGGVVFRLTYIISNRARFLKAPVYMLAVIAWSCVIADSYLLDISSMILSFGVVGKIFLMGFCNYILFPLTVCSLALLEIDKGELMKPLSWVGDIAYSLYLLHFPLQLSFGLAVSYGIINSDFYINPFYLGLYLVMLVPLSYLVFLNFERPMQKMIRSRFVSTNKS